ncbi:hypothetical protein SODG_004867 [Sodalis praecaptivus]
MKNVINHEKGFSLFRQTASTSKRSSCVSIDTASFQISEVLTAHPRQSWVFTAQCVENFLLEVSLTITLLISHECL